MIPSTKRRERLQELEISPLYNILVELEFVVLDFMKGGKPSKLGKKQLKTQPIYGNGPELNTGHFEGRGERGESALTTVPSLLPNDTDHS